MLHTNVAQLGEARTLANEAIREYDQAEEKCRDAVAKYDEASKLKTDDKFKEYLSLKVKEYNKRAEMIEALKATPQALIDSQNRAAFVSRANAATEKATRLGKKRTIWLVRQARFKKTIRTVSKRAKRGKWPISGPSGSQGEGILANR